VYTEFLTGRGQPGVWSKAPDLKRRTPYRPMAFYWSGNCQY